MSLTTANRKLLWARSGGFCALCKVPLTEDAVGTDPGIVLGEEAHIVSGKRGGPRYRPLPPRELDSPDNLVLLCPTDHTKVDAQQSHYSEEVLRRIKRGHEDWARQRDPKRLPAVRIRDLAPNEPTVLHHVVTGGQLTRVIGDSLSLATRRPDPLTTAEVDLIAPFFEGIADIIEIWQVVDLGDRLRAEHSLDQEIAVLGDAGFVVYAGTRRQVLEGGLGPSQSWSAATLAIYRSDDPTIQATSI